MMKSFLLLATLFFLVGCQTPKTKLQEETEARSKSTAEILSKDIVLLDARPPFDLATAPIKQATPVLWRDFVKRQGPFENDLEADLFFHARRMARLGIKPESEVIVIGRGSKGEGEEGRLAWTLRYLGVKNVNFKSMDEFRFPPQWMAAPDRQPVPIWRPEIQKDLIIQPQDLKKQLKSDADLIIVQVTDDPGHRMSSKQIGEHLKKDVSWAQLTDMSAEKRKSFFKEFLGESKATIAVVDPKGIKAASVTLWLRDAGYNSRFLAVGTKAAFP